ncbi:hypothetical protein SAMN06265795_101520 [Noviherbaspirillum humi]|uniref:Lon N-terminal domain-containing protein n=1 Tax=Noviherbaspirillum humi TaxID=1688639 RepID=A0A239CM24_9BURK|nr:LON peptidase substrate-binding domain-containing protein [Noviherbaspirillum humi]SNS20741.1 hypothetical protein SAMN06265795_101520 [Noviherbaspirillum humi]
MPAEPIWVPLFPLKTVLFPGGALPLRVFETRYIDMVRECMREELPFGVVLIKSGQEVGAAAEPEAVGCLAHITSWEMPSLGLMMLQTRGGLRFRILETRVLTDQRLEARIAMLMPEAPAPVTDDLHGCAISLETVIANIEAVGQAEQGSDFDSPFTRPLHFDDAGWVANRWCEILPIPLAARQKLLELDDPLDRLAIVQKYLKQHDIL